MYFRVFAFGLKRRKQIKMADYSSGGIAEVYNVSIFLKSMFEGECYVSNVQTTVLSSRMTDRGQVHSLLLVIMTHRESTESCSIAAFCMFCNANK